MELLRGRHNNSVTTQMKNSMWQKITDEVNAVGICFKSVSEVKNKYRNLQRDAKEKCFVSRREMQRTGGGQPPPITTPTEEMIINSLQNTPYFSGIE